MLQNYKIYNQPLSSLPEGNLLINTINAHSYNVSRSDAAFAAALHASDVLLPDGVSVVFAKRFLSGERIKKIAGEDLFYYEMRRVETHGRASQSNHGRASRAGADLQSEPSFGSTDCKSGLAESLGADERNTVMFLGSSEAVLAKIKARAAVEFPHVEVHTYSPPYKAEFSADDNAAMIAAVNAVNPMVLFVGMTAPKQEKWAWQMMRDERLMLNNCHVCCIGAVFDFYAGTVQRAPQLFIKLGLEWLYRLVKEPRRMWRRYLIGNVKFVWAILKEKMKR